MAPPTVSGDHIAMAAKAGAIAIPARAPSQSPIFIGYKVPAEIVYGKTSYRMWLPGTPHCIAVNRYGERFANDGFYPRSEEHTSELQSLMRISYAVFCLKKTNPQSNKTSVVLNLQNTLTYGNNSNS